MVLDFKASAGPTSHRVAHQPISTSALLKKALSLQSVSMPEVNAQGAVALRPRLPVRGQMAEPTPEIRVHFPRAVAGHAVVREVLPETSISETPAPPRIEMNIAKASPVEDMSEVTPQSHSAPHLGVTLKRPTRSLPSLTPGYLTSQIERRRGASFGR